MGVTSLMAEMSSPAACNDRIAASRPEPGPFTHTSTFFKPSEIASFAADSAEICAANGVLLRETLNPTFPALAQARQILPVPSAPIGADSHHALDVHRDLAAPRSFDLELRLDHLAQAAGFLFGETVHARVGADAGHRENLLRRRPSDPKDVRQRDFNALFVRQIDSGDTSQDAPPCLTLTLLVARVLADDAHDPLAPDDLAVLANPRNGRFDFHCRSPAVAICTGR